MFFIVFFLLFWVVWCFFFKLVVDFVDVFRCLMWCLAKVVDRWSSDSC